MDAKFYVPYETAQLLKEKGYEAETDYYYSKATKSITPLHDLKNEWYPDSLQIIIDTRYIPAPTYHEVLDWLAKNGWYVSVGLRLRGGVAYVSEAAKILWRPTLSCGAYRTREDALNAAILETLKRI